MGAQRRAEQCLHGLIAAVPLVVPEFAYQQSSLLTAKLCLNQPMLAKPDIRRLVALCAIADAHVERAIRLNAMDHFNSQVLTDLEAECQAHSPMQRPMDVLRHLHVLALFPYLEQGLTTGTLQLTDKQPGTQYLTYISLLNQLVMTATQLYHEACVPEHHKYIAHQLALLYQCLNLLQGDTKPLRVLIEQQFEEIKAISESDHPWFELSDSDWLQELSWLCREQVKLWPPYIHGRLTQVLGVLKQLPHSSSSSCA